MIVRRCIRRTKPGFASDEFAVEISSAEIGLADPRNPEQVYAAGRILSYLCTREAYAQALRAGSVSPEEVDSALKAFEVEKEWVERRIREKALPADGAAS